MQNKDSYIDHQMLASQFEVGDLVRLTYQSGQKSHAQTGKVTAVLESIGFVDVEFPWGNERVSPEDLSWVDGLKSPEIDTSLDTYDRRNSKMSALSEKIVSKYYENIRPLYREASQKFDEGYADLEVYDHLYSKYNSKFSDHEIKTVVSFVSDIR